jgi:hypothetical protein
MKTRTFRRRSGGIDPQARLRAGVEGLGRGVDGVKTNKMFLVEEALCVRESNVR